MSTSTERQYVWAQGRPPRVVFPFARHGHGGSSVSGGRLARGLASRHDVQTFVLAHSRGPAWRHLVDEGLQPQLLPGTRPAGLGFVDDESIPQIVSKLARLTRVAGRWLDTHEIDIIHANDDMVATAWGVAGQRRGIPLVWHIRQPMGNPMLDGLLSRLADYQIFVADGNRNRFSRLHLPNRTVYNGLDPSRYMPSLPAPQARTRIGLNSGLPVLGFVGNLVERKRPEWAIQVSAAIHKAGTDHHLVVAGEDYSGTRLSSLRSMAASLGVDHRVHLLGKRDDIPKLMRAFDVFLLTSRAEAFGLVVIEAMASGVPVVAAAVDGVPELIKHGVTGMLVPAEDLEAMVATTRDLLLDGDRRQAMGLAAQESVETRFSISRTVDGVAEIYGELVRQLVI